MAERNAGIGAALAAAAGLLLTHAVPAAGAGDAVARVTALAGSAKSGDQPLAGRAVVGEDGSVATDPDSNCSLLVDDHALIELCGDTRLRLTRRSDTGSRVIRLDEGEARIVVEPLAAGERIEIHTPAAIATILGSMIYVKHDAATGETTLTSDESDMKVQSSDTSLAKTTVVGAGQQLKMGVGEAPPDRPEELTQEARLAVVGGCFLGARDLRDLAVSLDSTKAKSDSIDRAATADSEAVAGEDVAAAVAAAPEAGLPDDPPDEPNSDDIQLEDLPMPEEEMPEIDVPCDAVGFCGPPGGLGGR